MDKINEVEILTKTKKRLLAQKEARALNPSKAFAMDTILSTAEVLTACGGQAALVFRAIVGSYGISKQSKRETGFTVHSDFERATGLGGRQFRRAIQRLATEGFIEADSAPGRKPIIRLTESGKRALVLPATRAPRAKLL